MYMYVSACVHTNVHVHVCVHVKLVEVTKEPMCMKGASCTMGNYRAATEQKKHKSEIRVMRAQIVMPAQSRASANSHASAKSRAREKKAVPEFSITCSFPSISLGKGNVHVHVPGGPTSRR